MMRKVYDLAAVVSLVLCVATAALWVRSYWHVDLVGAQGRETTDHWQRGGHVSSANGSLDVNWSVRQNGPEGSRSASADWAYETWPVRSVVPAAWHGFGYEAVNFDTSPVASDGRPMPVRMTYTHRVTMPHWFVVLLGMPAIALWVRRAARRRRAERRLRENLCAHCGYDLCATPGRCPECGAVTTTAARPPHGRNVPCHQTAPPPPGRS